MHWSFSLFYKLLEIFQIQWQSISRIFWNLDISDQKWKWYFLNCLMRTISFAGSTFCPPVDPKIMCNFAYFQLLFLVIFLKQVVTKLGSSPCGRKTTYHLLFFLENTVLDEFLMNWNEIVYFGLSNFLETLFQCLKKKLKCPSYHTF